MSYAAAILRSWEDVALLPGAYVVLLSEKTEPAIQARRHGFQLRDTLAIVRSGPRVSFAFLFRKEIEEKTVAHQVLATGTGAINIDACRISKKTGRWPTNLMLVHGGSCQSVGTRRIPGHKGYPNGPGGKSYQYTSNKRGSEVRPNAWAGHADADGLESVEDWSCEAGCPIALMNQQSGERPATLTGRADPTMGYENPSLAQKPGLFNVSGMGIVYADSGGAARYYVQAPSEADVLTWIRALITPPEGQLYETV